MIPTMFRFAAIGLIWLLPGSLLAQRPSAPSTRVIILPVNHSQQLVARDDQPGLLTAMIEELKPDVICIENSPDRTVRGEYYDFLYEQTSIILPLARARGIEGQPIDWEPGPDEQKLAFGASLDELPLVRPKSGWGAFLTFSRPEDLRAGFLDPQPDVVAHVKRWAGADPADASTDAPRRLYLFRTLLQAKRLAAVAQAHPGKTVLLVIGEFHKWDIERTLAHDRDIVIVQPAAVFHPDRSAAESVTTPMQRAAILTFNLLGLQSSTGNVDWDWTKSELAALSTSAPASERELFALRLEQLTGKVGGEAIIRRYQALLERTPEDARFSWTGNNLPDRIDSYFDPFGNLSVRRRVWLELARAQFEAGQTGAAKQSFAKVLDGLSEQKVFQGQRYADLYLWTKAGAPG